jgi:hypothetical protein
MAKIIHNKGEAGGYLVGNRHSEGGIKAINKSTGQPLEMEGGEVVITRNAVSDTTKRSFNGKMMTNREILSTINKSGGGVEFEEGGEVPSTIEYIDSVLEYDGEKLNSRKVLEKMAEGGELSNILSGFDVDSALGEGVMSYAAGGSTRRVKSKVSGTLNLKKPVIGISGRPKLSFDFTDLPLPAFAGGVYFNAGAVSSVVKQLFKKEVPYQKVSVSSQVFSGGDSIDIWPDDPKGWITPDAKKFAQDLKDNFRSGTFDGMTDSYNYSSTQAQFIVNKVNGLDFDLYEQTISNDRKVVRELDVDVKYFTVNNRPKYGTKAYDEYENRPAAEPEQEMVVVEAQVPSTSGIEILEDEAPTKTFANPDTDAETEMARIQKFIDEIQFLIDVTPDYQFEKKVELGSNLAGLYNEYNLFAAKKNKSLYYGSNAQDKTYRALLNMVGQDTDISMKIERNPETSKTTKNVLEMLYEFKSGTHQFRESFLDWFGNFDMNTDAQAMLISQSKVIKGNGEYGPKVVWHGLKTLKDQFRTFKFPTTYFAVNKSYADYFSTVRGGEGYVIPFYLNVRNPLDLTPFGITKVKPKDFMDYMFLKTMMTPKELGFPDAFLEDGVPPLEVWVYLRRFPKFVETIRDTKLFDGFHFFENNPAVPEDSASYQTEVWTTFYPNQSKAIYDRNKYLRDVLGQNNSMWFKKGGQL